MADPSSIVTEALAAPEVLPVSSSASETQPLATEPAMTATACSDESVPKSMATATVSAEDAQELEAWKQVHATLIQAVMRAQLAVHAQKAQRRFWLEEVCGNLTDTGKLVAGSVWKRPPMAAGNPSLAYYSRGSAGGSRKAAGSTKGTSPTNSQKRKQKDTSPSDKSSAKKARKKKHSEDSQPEEEDDDDDNDDDDADEDKAPPKKKVKVVVKRPQDSSTVASASSAMNMSSSRPLPQPIYPHPPAFHHPAHAAMAQFPNAAMLASQQWSNTAAAAAQNGNLQLMAAVAFGQTNPSFFFPPPPMPQQAQHLAHAAYPAPPRNYTSLHDLEKAADDDSDDERNHTF